VTWRRSSSGCARRRWLEQAASLAADAADESGIAVVAHRAPDGTGGDDLRKLAIDVRGRLDSSHPAVVAVSAVSDGRPVIVVAVNDRGRERGLAAGELVRIAAGVLGGGGGGRDDVAQGGGTNPSAVDDALGAVRRRVAEQGG